MRAIWQDRAHRNCCPGHKGSGCIHLDIRRKISHYKFTISFFLLILCISNSFHHFFLKTNIKNIDVCKTLMPPFPNIWKIGLTFDLDLWPTTWISIRIIYSWRTIYLPSLKHQGQSVPDLSVAQGLRDWHDLWTWPTDMTIIRDHLLIKDYLPTKFEASGAKCCWFIHCTRIGRLTWPLTPTFDLLTWLSIGIILLIKDYLPT